MRVMTLDSANGGFRGLAALSSQAARLEDALARITDAYFGRVQMAHDSGVMSDSEEALLWDTYNTVDDHLAAAERGEFSADLAIAEANDYITTVNHMLGRPGLPAWVWWSMGTALLFGGAAAAVVYATPRKGRRRRLKAPRRLKRSRRRRSRRRRRR